MSTVEDIRNEIKTLYNDLTTLKFEQEPVRFAGTGKAQFVKNEGPTSVIYDSSEFMTNARELLIKGQISSESALPKLGGNVDFLYKHHLGNGEVNVLGELSVEVVYNSPNYVFSRDELLKSVANYSHLVEVKNANGKVKKRYQYWPNILEHFAKNGDFDLNPKEWLEDLKNRVSRVFNDEGSLTNNRKPSLRQYRNRSREKKYENTEDMKFEEAIMSADTVRSVYESSPTKNCITVLGSINPFLLAQPEKIVIKGDNMRLYYVGEKPFKARVRGSIEIYSDEEFPSFELPVAINSRFSEIPLTDSKVMRSDGIPKSQNTLIKSPVEMYIEDSNEIKVRRDTRGLMKEGGKILLLSYPFTGATLLTLLGFGSWYYGHQYFYEGISLEKMMGLFHQFLDLFPVFYLTGFGFAVVHRSRDILRLPKKVGGNGNMNILLKGYEQ